MRPLLDDMGARGVFDFGDAVGSATTVKIVGNFLIVSAARSMTEGLAIARANGVDAAAVVEMLTSTLFAAPIYQSYGKRLLDGPPPMRGGIPQKDLGFLRQIGGEGGVPTPLAEVLHELVKA